MEDWTVHTLGKLKIKKETPHKATQGHAWQIGQIQIQTWVVLCLAPLAGWLGGRMRGVALPGAREGTGHGEAQGNRTDRWRKGEEVSQIRV